MVDANVLAMAADRGDRGHEACRSQLEVWRTQSTPWYLTWPILFDFLRLVTHPGIYRHPWSIDEAWSYVEAILATPTLSVLTAGESHQQIIDSLLKELPDLRGELMHETQVAATMIEHGIKQIVTRDLAFNRFPMLEVVDPLRASA